MRELTTEAAMTRVRIKRWALAVVLTAVCSASGCKKTGNGPAVIPVDTAVLRADTSISGYDKSHEHVYVNGKMTDAADAMTAARRAEAAVDIARVHALSPPSIADSSEFADTVEYIGVPVYFGTTRKRSPSGPLEGRFANEESPNGLTYGEVVVSIPNGLRPGQTDLRGACGRYPWKFHCSRTPAKNVMLVSMNTMAPDVWSDSLRSSLAPPDTANLLIYVHGFANSFGDAVLDAARLAHTIGFRGSVAVFDWASRGSVAKYPQDHTIATGSITEFRKFIGQVMSVAKPNRIYWVAHSMGAELSSTLIKDLVDHNALPLQFNQVVFPAADIDSAYFVNELAPSLENGAARVTLYASDHDRALKAGELAYNGRARVGSGPPHVVLVRHIDYVDASEIRTDWIGHGYFRENKALLDDLFYLIRYGFPASGRALVPQTVPGGIEPYYAIRTNP